MFGAINRKVWGVVGAMAFGLCAAASAQPLGFVQTLDRPAGEPQFSVRAGIIAADGDLALIGGRSPVGSTGYNWVVDAYQFIDGTWIHIQTLESPDLAKSEGNLFFGNAIKMDGGIAVIADPHAPRGDQFDGAAYVYRWDGVQWNYEQKLTSSTPSGGDGYAQWLGVSGETIVVAAPSYESGSGPVFQGLVFVYEVGRSGAWEEIQIIEEPEITGLWAGEGLVFDNDILVFGSHTGDVTFWQPHVLTRDESGMFVFDLSFPIELNDQPLDTWAFDVDGDEVLMIRGSSAFGVASQISFLGFTNDPSGDTGWMPSTLVGDPSPGLEKGNWTGNYNAMRRGDRILMSTGLQRPLSPESEPVWRTLVFDKNPDGGWSTQTLSPPPGFKPTDWEIYQIQSNDNGQWFIAGGTDTGAVAVYAPITPQTCPGDLNNDAIVDADDLGILLGAFGSSCP